MTKKQREETLDRITAIKQEMNDRLTADHRADIRDLLKEKDELRKKLRRKKSGKA